MSVPPPPDRPAAANLAATHAWPVPPASGAGPGALACLRTPRLWLLACQPALLPGVTAFLARNAAHFAPWDPPQAPGALLPAAQAERLRQGQLAFQGGSALRWWMLPADATPGMADEAGLRRAVAEDRLPVIGQVHFSQVARGAFQNTSLGYGLDAGHQGRGLMTEALRAAIAEVFSPRVNLHRIQAAWQPRNLASGAVLARLGFDTEGLARDYLYIDGAWRDHHISTLRHPGFVRPPHWPVTNGRA